MVAETMGRDRRGRSGLGRRSRALALLLPLALAAVAGCVGDDDVETADASKPDGDEPSLLPGNRTEIVWNDTLETTVCHPSGVRSCTYYTPVGAPNEERAIDDLLPARHLNATLEWTASSRTTEELRLGIYRTESCGEGCTRYSKIRERQGPSPVTLQARNLTAGSQAVRVEAPDLGPGPTMAKVVVEQPFEVTFTVTSPTNASR
jgi:hypothetical protein